MCPHIGIDLNYVQWQQYFQAKVVLCVGGWRSLLLVPDDFVVERDGANQWGGLTHMPKTWLTSQGLSRKDVSLQGCRNPQLRARWMESMSCFPLVVEGTREKPSSSAEALAGPANL